MTDKIHPHSLKPAALMRLLNTAGYGTVLSEHRLRRHRNRAGYAIGSDKTVNLFKYAAWLTQEFFREKPTPKDYLEKKRQANLKSTEAVRAAQDIGEIPEVRNVDRKANAVASFKTFCESYFSEVFYLPWSEDHLHVIEKIEKAVLQGGLFALAMPRGSGKALALDIPIPTPSGWSTMGDLKVGDEIFDENGMPCRVTFATEIQYNRKCYTVEFSDSERIVCDAEHLWTVNDRWSRRNPLTLTTEEMLPHVVLSQSRGWTEFRYRIPTTKPLQLPDAALPIDPYTLGIWLGDGDCKGSGVSLNGDDTEEICAFIEQSDETALVKIVRDRSRNCSVVRLTKNRVKSLSFQGRLRNQNLLHNKHIPAEYLRASFEQRLALLQGIMDTDGYVDTSGHCEIAIKYPGFADTFGERMSL